MVLHESVLLKEVIGFLSPGGAGKVIVDGTVGAGGHSEAILELLGPGGRLIGFDRDEQALALAEKRLERFKGKFMLIHENYKNLVSSLKKERQNAVDGVLLDLGVSSMQLDGADRGFSFAKDGPLDMRMDRSEGLSAEKLINEAGEKTLLEILWKYGEERFARRIVKAILSQREISRITTTRELAAVVERSVPPFYRHGRIHPATRTFQALRMAVNEELGSLDAFLSSVMEVLKVGARVVIISFHSLEDRKVKQAFRDWKSKDLGNILTKKPVIAAEEETARNPRSRSAKLRAFEKMEAAS